MKSWLPIAFLAGMIIGISVREAQVEADSGDTSSALQQLGEQPVQPPAGVSVSDLKKVVNLVTGDINARIVKSRQVHTEIVRTGVIDFSPKSERDGMFNISAHGLDGNGDPSFCMATSQDKHGVVMIDFSDGPALTVVDGDVKKRVPLIKLLQMANGNEK